MTKLTIMDADAKLQEIELTFKDIMKMQTKESKRTVALGIGATALNLVSFIVPKPFKMAVAGAGLVMTAATVVSNIDSINHCDDQDNLDHINSVIAEAATRNNVKYVY